MRKFLLILACCAGFYLLLFEGFRLVTDVGELAKSYPKVVYNKKTKESHIEIVKTKPPGWVSLGQVSRIAVSAIVISEDWSFYQHNGFDWEQIKDSMEKNLRQGRFARGGSTITQQVVKNVYLSSEKTLWRKAHEAVLAVRIERQLTKQRILEIYLNIAEFGQGLYGIGSAARFYFSKPASQLSAKEGAFLAMLLPSPKKYSVSFRMKALTPYASSIVRSILGKLLVTQRLSQEQYQQELNTPLSFEERKIPEPAVAPEDESMEDSLSKDEGNQGQGGAPDTAIDTETETQSGAETNTATATATDLEQEMNAIPETSGEESSPQGFSGTGAGAGE
jgi:monofunctional biosynthetic peptidoglycan transglycosylase